MGWSGRAPAPPATNLARGSKDKEHAMSQNLNSAVAVIGIDIGKNSFHVVGLDDRGAIVLRQKWSRGQIEARLANLPPCLVGMEACVGAHHLSRRLKEHERPVCGWHASCCPSIGRMRSSASTERRSRKASFWKICPMRGPSGAAPAGIWA